MIIAYVFNSREGKSEALRELNASNDGERDEAVEKGHKAGGSEEEKGGGGGDTSGSDLRNGEVRCLGNGNGSNGFHGLNRHRDSEESAGDDVVECSEDKGSTKVEMGD